MWRFIFIIAFVTTLTSCYNVNVSDDTPPEILLSESQMIEVLTEMQIIEAGFNIKENRKNAAEIKPGYYKKLLEKYGITLPILKDNIDYYNKFPKVMENIYEKVLANLSKVQSDVLNEIEEIEAIRVQDSILASDTLKPVIIPDSLENISDQ